MTERVSAYHSSLQMSLFDEREGLVYGMQFSDIYVCAVAETCFDYSVIIAAVYSIENSFTILGAVSEMK